MQLKVYLLWLIIITIIIIIIIFFIALVKTSNYKVLSKADKEQCEKVSVKPLCVHEIVNQKCKMLNLLQHSNFSSFSFFIHFFIFLVLNSY